MLRKFLVALFFISLIAGHQMANAQDRPASKIQSQCKAMAESICETIGKKQSTGKKSKASKVPVFPQRTHLKNCNDGYHLEAFIRNVPQQEAQKAAADPQNKDLRCDQIKKAHKACHVVAKKGKKVITDDHIVFDNKGESQCDLRRSQITDKSGNTTDKVVRTDSRKADPKRGGEENSVDKRYKRYVDKRVSNQHVVTQAAKSKSAR